MLTPLKTFYDLSPVRSPIQKVIVSSERIDGDNENSTITFFMSDENKKNVGWLVKGVRFVNNADSISVSGNNRAVILETINNLRAYNYISMDFALEICQHYPIDYCRTENLMPAGLSDEWRNNTFKKSVFPEKLITTLDLLLKKMTALRNESKTIPSEMLKTYYRLTLFLSDKKRHHPDLENEPVMIKIKELETFFKDMTEIDEKNVLDELAELNAQLAKLKQRIERNENRENDEQDALFAELHRLASCAEETMKRVVAHESSKLVRAPIAIAAFFEIHDKKLEKSHEDLYLYHTVQDGALEDTQSWRP